MKDINKNKISPTNKSFVFTFYILLIIRKQILCIWKYSVHFNFFALDSML